MTLEREIAFARRIAELAGDQAARIRKDGISAETKPDQSPVTIADRENERLIREAVEDAFPHDGILGEEGSRKDGTSGRRWIIDPIDGTRDFVRGNRLWCVLIALESEGESQAGVAHFPMLGETYWAVRGLGSFCGERRLRASAIDRLEAAVLSPNGMHMMNGETYAPRMMEFMSRSWAVRSLGGALDACMLADGQIDFWLERKAEVWDLAPLQVIIEEAGGVFFALDGSRRFDRGNAVACAPGIEPEARRFFAFELSQRAPGRSAPENRM